MRTWFLIFASVCLSAQTSKKLTFDTASVTSAPTDIASQTAPKGESSGPRPVAGTGGTSGAGRVFYRYATLRDLLMAAYDVKDFQIAGPSWIEKYRYAVQATMPDATTDEQFREMLQNLLTDRFKMTIHKESRELGVYSLKAVPSGVVMNGSTPIVVNQPTNSFSLSEKNPIVNTLIGSPPQTHRWTAWQATMADLVKRLEREVNHPVLDETGLRGKYNFTLNFLRPESGAPAANASKQPPLPDIFGALRSLGLILEPKKGPVPVVVVDSAQTVPSGK